MSGPQDPPQTPRWTDYPRLDEVLLANRNPKLHDEAGISGSIKHHGMGETPLRDERTGRLVAGHGRYEQLLAMHAAGEQPPDGILVDDDGMWRMPVTAGWASRSDADAEAYLVGSNRLTEKGGHDDLLLAEILGDLAGDNLLELAGYDQGDLDAMEALFAAGGGEFSEDEFDDLTGGDEKGPEDPWPTVHIRVPPQLAESWKAHLDTCSGNEVAAFAELLGVDPAELDT